MPLMSAPDPRGFNSRETLRDGTAVTLRALRPDDRERMRAAFARLSPTTLYLRTFSFRKELAESELRRYVEVDFDRTVALVVTTGEGPGERVIGGGRYVRAEGADTAEVAFTVDEDHRGLGIASRLLTHLIAIAGQRGMRRFDAEVLAENGPMLAVFARSGLPMKQRREGSVVHVELALTPSSG
jgi:RimJ/RimL family protein N-acetyltransferase